MNKSPIFRELKSRKRKFGFQTLGMYTPESFIQFAEAIKRTQSLDPNMLLDVNYSGATGVFTIYTDEQIAADELRAYYTHET